METLLLGVELLLGKVFDALLENAQECLAVIAELGEIAHMVLDGLLALLVHNPAAFVGNADVDLALIEFILLTRNKPATLERADDLGDAGSRKRDLIGDLDCGRILIERLEEQKDAEFALGEFANRLRCLEDDTLGKGYGTFG